MDTNDIIFSAQSAYTAIDTVIKDYFENDFRPEVVSYDLDHITGLLLISIDYLNRIIQHVSA